MHSLYISLFAYFIVSWIFVLLFVYRLNASSLQVPQARTCNPVLRGDELSASLRNSVIINVWNSNTMNNLSERLWSRNRCLEIMWWKVFKIELRKSSEGRPEYHRRQKRKCRGTNQEMCQNRNQEGTFCGRAMKWRGENCLGFGRTTVSLSL